MFYRATGLFFLRGFFSPVQTTTVSSRPPPFSARTEIREFPTSNRRQFRYCFGASFDLLLKQSRKYDTSKKHNTIAMNPMSSPLVEGRRATHMSVENSTFGDERRSPCGLCPPSLRVGTALMAVVGIGAVLIIALVGILGNHTSPPKAVGTPVDTPAVAPTAVPTAAPPHATLVACSFYSPVVQWVSYAPPSARCPPTGHTQNCTKDADCSIGINPQCLPGGTSLLVCESSVCSIFVGALPSLTQGVVGLCDSSAEEGSTCARCNSAAAFGSEECTGGAFCVARSKCGSPAFVCYPTGHSATRAP